MKHCLLREPGDPSVTIELSFAVGSQDDPPGKEGLAALTAALLTEGATETNAYEAILEKLYPLATDYSAEASREMTTIGGRVHADKLDLFVDLLLDAVLRPAFRNDDFDRLKSDAVNFVGNTLRYSSDEELGKAALTAAVFENTRYAHPVAGTLTGLRSISLDDVRSFYRQHFVRERLTIGVGGGFAPELPGRLEQALSRLAAGTGTAAPDVEPGTRSGRRVVLVDKPGADASISFGFPLSVRRGERDFYSLWIANSWLGEHRNSASHLYQVIRERRGLNYGDYSYIEAFPHGGELQMPPVNVPRRRQLFEVWIRTLPNDRAVFALRAALRELDRLIDDGMSATQFELRRRFLKKYSTHFAPTTAARLGYAIDDRFYAIGSVGHLERFKTMMDELTLDEVNAAIRRHLQSQHLTIAIVTGDAAGLKNVLANDTPTPIEYANPMPRAILDEDEHIARYPLAINDDAIEVWPVRSVFD